MLEIEIYNILKKKSKEKRLPNSIILVPYEPEGGIAEAREIVRQNFCLKEGEENCSCLMCYHLKNLNHPDYFEIRAIKNQITIDQIREMKEEAIKPPFEADSRFFVIHEAHKLNVPASNAFLKILEEPPEWSYFILLTCQPNLLIPTIKSRCIIFQLPLSKDTIKIPENIRKAFEEFLITPELINLYFFIDELSKEPLHLIPTYLLNLNPPQFSPFLLDIAFELEKIITSYPQTFNLKLLLESLFLPKWHKFFYSSKL